MERLTLEMSGMQVIMAMAAGNIGAAKVCMLLIAKNAEIDTKSAFGAISTLLNMDSKDIHDERIWMLYKYVCNEDLPTMIFVMRAVQLGILPIDELQAAITGLGKGFLATEYADLARIELEL